MSRNIIVLASIFCVMFAISVVEAQQQRSGSLVKRINELETRIINLENKYRSAVSSTCGRGQFVRGRNASGTYKCANAK